PPDSEDEQHRLTSTLHALDHAARLAEAASGGADFATVAGGPEDVRAGELCADAMRSAASVAGEVAAPLAATQSPQAKPISSGSDAASGSVAIPTEDALAQLKRCAEELRELGRSRRRATLGAVANGTLTADAAIVRVDALRTLEALAHHAWRSAAHLVGRGE